MQKILLRKVYETITTGINRLSKIISSHYNFGDEDYILKYE
jgi:hypothetical protein